jgi:hypothetical protein
VDFYRDDIQAGVNAAASRMAMPRTLEAIRDSACTALLEFVDDEPCYAKHTTFTEEGAVTLKHISQLPVISADYRGPNRHKDKGKTLATCLLDTVFWTAFFFWTFTIVHRPLKPSWPKSF